MQDPHQHDSGVPESPYRPPEAALAQQRFRLPRLPPLLHRLLSVLIAVLCGFYFVNVWILELRVLYEYGLDFMPLGRVAQSMAMPLAAALGGVFLAFERRMAVLAFAVYVSMYAVSFGAGGADDPFTFAVAVLFLAYSAWRWKTGALTGWPQRRAG